MAKRISNSIFYSSSIFFGENEVRERFFGTEDRDFSDSIQLDEVALQRSQSIEGKAKKAVLRAKKKADIEREAYIDRFGMDSVATIRQQSEAEAKEAESEGGNKGAGK